LAAVRPFRGSGAVASFAVILFTACLLYKIKSRSFKSGSRLSFSIAGVPPWIKINNS
jgi:hypothetical protein